MSRVFLVASLSMLMACPATAAGLHDMAGTVTQVPKAPVVVNSCDLASAYFGVNITNQSTLQLTSFSVRFQTFDAPGKIIDSQTFDYDANLASGDSNKFTDYMFAGTYSQQGTSVTLVFQGQSATIPFTIESNKLTIALDGTTSAVYDRE
jgi:hypothetical protein